MNRLILPLFLLVLAYAVAAYIFLLPPFDGAIPGPTGCIHYQVFVDITGSNDRRGNWESEAEKLVDRLKPCDSIDFWTIDDRTGGNAVAADTIEIPFVDRGASREVLRREEEALRVAIETARNTIMRMVTETSNARTSDVINLFNRLDPAEAPMSNTLIVFSDGLESVAPAVNLERLCVSGENQSALADATVDLVTFPDAIAAFLEVIWVVPDLSGNGRCNSLQEIRPFWEVVVGRLAGGRAPRLTFDTNPF